MHYQVIVRSQGEVVAHHNVEASSGLAAINQVELLYGEPVWVEYVTVELEDGSKRHKMVVHNWHGYSFLATQTTSND